MPYIRTAVSTKITHEKEITLKERLGKAISLIPGKSEGSLMLEFNDNCHLYLGGKNDTPIGFVDVKLFGASTKEAYNSLTAEICKILEDELEIPQNKVYVKYDEVFNWGCNGKNF